MTEVDVTCVPREIMNRHQAAAYLGIGISTLAKWKIPHPKIGKLSLYRKKDIDEWLANQTFV